ncbi:hypothetical protein MANES_12G059262v8 [Manihot esculenta]|uniref:Uncharacterized protein n=1 Tax=Manihot esculenta TaxID=3983 RepID=A0ACB7GTT0_MANES|nr:hypothetical protein MANES_12G059262v8 [Manihot esculenta]
MEKAGGEESFSRFLNMEKTVTRVSPSIFGSFSSNSPSPPPPPCVAQPADDAGSKISPPAIVAAQPSASPAPTKTRRGGYRKAMPPEMLANLVMHDPKKAKRIITNRMSAVRAKEKKKLHTFMLEHQAKKLRSESALLTAQLSLMQKESLSLTTEHEKLKEEKSLILQRIHLQNILNDEVRNEIRQLKMLIQNQHQAMMLNNTTSENDGLDMNLQVQVQVQNPHQQLEVMNNAGQQFPWQLHNEDHEHQLQQSQKSPTFMNPNLPLNPIQQYQNSPPFVESYPNLPPNPIQQHQNPPPFMEAYPNLPPNPIQQFQNPPPFMEANPNLLLNPIPNRQDDNSNS